jgi:VWFA-related protein
MRRLILVAALAALALPALAARRLTIAQLEQTLSAEISAQRADADVAHKIGELELSERLTSVRLDRVAGRFKLGPHTALALELLADRSAFLDPPADELPATEPPDAATQQRMMDSARGYVTQAVPRLPDFFATRTTIRFDDGPQVVKEGDWPVRAGLHLAGTTSRQITFRDGKEAIDAPAQPVAADDQAQQELGLHTFGEFGPELSIVLTDTAKGQVTWSHWEQTSSGLAAVFHYEVPRTASHYAVNYCCIRDEEFVERRELTFRSRGQSPQQMANLPKTDASRSFRDTPGYHGSIFVDSATGAILRITLEAELKESDPITHASTVVEYGPVKIGEQRYILPVRSLAVSMEPATYNANGQPRTPATLLINETSFTHYHKLGATLRLLADNGASGGNDAAPGNAIAVNGAGTAETPGSPPSMPPGAAQPASGATVAAISSPPPAPPAPAALPAPPAQPVVPEVTLSDASGLPDHPADSADTPESGVTLKLTSRLVDVGVVVYDKKGHPVKDLKQEDFEVYDNGRKQDIRFFSEFSSAGPAPAPAGPGSAPASAAAPAATAAQAAPGAAAPASAAPPEQSFSNRAPDPAAPASANAPLEQTTILLFDESHIAWADLNNARQQAIKFLKSVSPDERVGLYTMTTMGFKVLTEITTDHAALISRLQKWMPSAQSVSQAQEEEIRNRQQFNEVQNASDLNSVNGNLTDVADGGTPVDPQLLTMGDNPARASLVILGGVARHLSAVPGHKNLIWISSDNVFADFRDQAVGIDKSSKYIDSFALRAQEAMNDAHVAVYPFDVSQLEGAAITADMQHRNVELTQASQDVAALAQQGAAASGRGGGSSTGGGRDMTPGRVTAEMNQDIHPIQGPIRQVADATGGRTVRRSGDLAGEMAGIVAEGHTTYMLSFRPDTIADNQYHNIAVKLAGKRGLTARYRTGYLYAKEPSTLRERFQQAVWRPMDANEVAVTAGVDKLSSGANVKINVATGDLGMQQRGGRWMDKLDIFFIQRDDAGVHAQVEGETLGLRLKPATYQNLLPAGVPFEHAVRLKPGTASLRVLVVDENSGRMGSVTIPAEALGDGH